MKDLKNGKSVLQLEKIIVEDLSFKRFSSEIESALGKRLLSNNVVAILFPYIRSQLTLLTSQPGFDSPAGTLVGV